MPCCAPTWAACMPCVCLGQARRPPEGRCSRCSEGGCMWFLHSGSLCGTARASFACWISRSHPCVLRSALQHYRSLSAMTSSHAVNPALHDCWSCTCNMLHLLLRQLRVAVPRGLLQGLLSMRAAPSATPAAALMVPATAATPAAVQPHQPCRSEPDGQEGHHRSRRGRVQQLQAAVALRQEAARQGACVGRMNQRTLSEGWMVGCRVSMCPPRMYACICSPWLWCVPHALAVHPSTRRTAGRRTRDAHTRWMGNNGCMWHVRPLPKVGAAMHCCMVQHRPVRHAHGG